MKILLNFFSSLWSIFQFSVWTWHLRIVLLPGFLHVLEANLPSLSCFIRDWTGRECHSEIWQTICHGVVRYWMTQRYCYFGNYCLLFNSISVKLKYLEGNKIFCFCSIFLNVRFRERKKWRTNEWMSMSLYYIHIVNRTIHCNSGEDPAFNKLNNLHVLSQRDVIHEITGMW